MDLSSTKNLVGGINKDRENEEGPSDNISPMYICTYIRFPPGQSLSLSSNVGDRTAIMTRHIIPEENNSETGLATMMLMMTTMMMLKQIVAWKKEPTTEESRTIVYVVESSDEGSSFSPWQHYNRCTNDLVPDRRRKRKKRTGG